MSVVYLALILSLSLITPRAFADTFIADFLSNATIESTTAVVNIALGYIHPPLQIYQWSQSGSAPFSNTALDVGDGSLGPFNNTTYLQFNDETYNNDQVIHINTDVHPTLNVTVFTLDNGWTIRPYGSQPLKIHSLTSITINGTIDCSGDNGQGLLSDNTLTSAGGNGHCGGGYGGNGGSVTVAATSGSASGPNSSGPGSPGTTQGDGGGGGGAYSQAGTSATGATPGGTAGTNQQDDGFTVEGGGAGGGGGAVYNNVTDPTNLSSGGGGGGGGGTIHLIAVQNITISATGVVLANGGIGGGVTGTGKGGSGGGGGAGSILIMAGGVLTMDGTVHALPGSGGTGDGGKGGNGATGRTWLNDSTGTPSGSSIENPTTLLVSTGSVNYQTGTFTITSQQIDTQSSSPTFSTASNTNTATGASTVALQVAGSSEPFSASSANWVDSSSVASLNGSRYFRYQLSLDNQSNSSPTTISSVQISYTPSVRDNFNFVTGCGLIKRGGSGGNSLTVILNSLLILMLPLLTCAYLRWRSPAES